MVYIEPSPIQIGPARRERDDRAFSKLELRSVARILGASFRSSPASPLAERRLIGSRWIAVSMT